MALVGLIAAIGCGSDDKDEPDKTPGPDSGGAPPAASGGATGGAIGGNDSGGSNTTGGATLTSGGTANGGAPGTGGASGGANPGGGAPGSGGESAVVGTIDDLTIEANPNNVLSAWVSWTTSEPSDSVVQFGEGEWSFQVMEEEAVTEHRVLVIGMHAETEYQMRALSAGPNGTVQATAAFTTGTLPPQIPVATISIHDETRAQEGWTLMNVQQGDGTNRAISGAPPTAVAYDEQGQPVWYFIHGTTPERGGAISVDPTDQGVIMGPTLAGPMGGDPYPPIEVDWAGETIWTCDDPLCGVPDQLSHHADKLSNGNYVVMRDASMGSLVSQVFLEFSPDSPTPVHEVGVEDAMMPPQSASFDWAHGNAITIDLENDFAYMSFRWLGLIKMQYSTKTPIWHLPASYGQEQLGVDFGDMAFDPPESQFSDIHDPEIHEDGTILFFDNGGFTNMIEDGNPANLHTRALEYSIDEQAKVATLEWEWPGSFDVDPWYTTELYVPFWGDADRLQNGNVMITAGRRGTVEITPESRIIEVTKDTGEVVWELLLPKDHGVYRAERLWPLPLVTRIE